MSKPRVPKVTPQKQVSHPELPQHVALYMRVSTEDQADRGTIDAQRNFLRQFANLYQLPVADEYADDGVTGTLPLGKRPEGQRLLQDAEAGLFSSVLVYRLTRLGRSLKALTEAHDHLYRFGVTIRSASEPFDTSTPIGNFVFQLLSSLAELDRAQVIEQLNRGRDRVARNGKWTDGPVPFGYTLNDEGCLTPSARIVDVAKMTEAELVKDLFTRIADGSTAIAEARRLNALGVPPTCYFTSGKARRGGTHWYPVRIAHIIAASTYKGTHVYQSRYGAIEREVDTLVDEPLWRRANVQLQENRRLPKSNATRTYLLRGLITCGVCDCTYIGQGLTRANGKRSLYYRCGNRSASINPEAHARCTSRSVDAAWLEDLIWQDCRSFIRHPGDALAEAQRQLQTRQQNVSKVEQERATYLHALTEKAKERDSVMVLARRGAITIAYAEGQLNDIAREEATLLAHCRALDAQRALVDAHAMHLSDAKHMLQQLQAQLAEVDALNDQTTKRGVIELLVQKIRVDTMADAPKGSPKYSVEVQYAFTPTRVALQTSETR